MSHQSRAAIILDGADETGLSANYLDKATQSTLIEYVLDSVWTVADQIYVIFSKEPDLKLVESIAPYGVKIIVQGRRSSSLSSLASGLNAVQSESVFIIPSTVPFIKPNVIFALFDGARNHDAAIPRWSDGRIEPLLSVYARKALLKVIPTRPRGRIESLVDNLYAIRYIGIEDELKSLDPDLYSFFYVKSRKDLPKARRIASLALRHPK